MYLFQNDLNELAKKCKYTDGSNIDNKLFYKEMVDWKKKFKEAQEMDEPAPPVSEYIATCFYKLLILCVAHFW